MRTNIKYLPLFVLSVSILACKPSAKQSTGVYMYHFEKVAPITTETSKERVADYLAIKTVHDLTVSKDENIAYFVADEDVNTTFEQHLGNGNFSFSKLTKDYLAKDEISLPSKEESIRIAEKFMDTKGIAPKTISEMRLVHSGGLRSQSVIDGKKAGPIIDKLITLTYGRVVDSVPVIGSGSKIIMNIGENGEVVGMTRHWRELDQQSRKELKPTEILSRKEAEELATKQIMEEFGAGTSIRIKSAQKSYYDGNGNILQPVWAFDTELKLGGENREPVKYLCIIQMMKNSDEPIRINKLDPKARDLIKELKGSGDLPPKTNDPKNND